MERKTPKELEAMTDQALEARAIALQNEKDELLKPFLDEQHAVAEEMTRRHGEYLARKQAEGRRVQKVGAR